jgi:hypothetical protein
METTLLDDQSFQSADDNKEVDVYNDLDQTLLANYNRSVSGREAKNPDLLTDGLRPTVEECGMQNCRRNLIPSRSNSILNRLD